MTVHAGLSKAMSISLQPSSVSASVRFQGTSVSPTMPAVSANSKSKASFFFFFTYYPDLRVGEPAADDAPSLALASLLGKSRQR